MEGNFKYIKWQIDRIDSLIEAMSVGAPPKISVDALKEILTDCTEKMKSAMIVETGNDPWEQISKLN